MKNLALSNMCKLTSFPPSLLLSSFLTQAPRFLLFYSATHFSVPRLLCVSTHISLLDAERERGTSSCCWWTCGFKLALYVCLDHPLADSSHPHKQAEKQHVQHPPPPPPLLLFHLSSISASAHALNHAITLIILTSRSDPHILILPMLIVI